MFIFLPLNQVYAAENILYLDIEKIRHSSEAGKLINEKINNNHKLSAC